MYACVCVYVYASSSTCTERWTDTRMRWKMGWMYLYVYTYACICIYIYMQQYTLMCQLKIWMGACLYVWIYYIWYTDACGCGRAYIKSSTHACAYKTCTGKKAGRVEREGKEVDGIDTSDCGEWRWSWGCRQRWRWWPPSCSSDDRGWASCTSWEGKRKHIPTHRQVYTKIYISINTRV